MNIKKLKIWWTKRQLRRAYKAYWYALDSSHAGRHMARQLPSVIRLKMRCNRLIERLQKLNPSFGFKTLP